MRGNRLLSCTLAILLFLSLPLFGQEEERMEDQIMNLPPWLILEYGKKAMEEGEYGLALRYFREAINKERTLPEAEMLIGDVFAEEVNYEIAERQYLKALDQSRQLYILDEQYTILYKLAGLYRMRGKQGDREREKEMFLRITESDTPFSDALASNLADRYLEILTDDGFDKFVTLYRFDSKAALLAHTNLAGMFYEEEDYRRSALHYLFAVMTVFSKSIEELMFHDPDYEYNEAEEFFARCERFELITDYFWETSLYPNIFYLADSLYRIFPSSGKDSAVRLMRLAAEEAEDRRTRLTASNRLSEIGLE